MDAESRIDNVFIEAFETNHPAMLDWVSVKFELKELRNKKQNCTQCETLKAEVERLKGDKENNPWCLKCKEPDCLIESDGTCSMIKIYLEVTK